MRAQGWDIDLIAHVRQGGRVLGICGGYQMLGYQVSDPEGIEGPAQSVPGLGLLDATTLMSARKTLRAVSGVILPGRDSFSGYEMHVGSTVGGALRRPLLELADGNVDGAITEDGRIAGCYVHGLFSTTAARSALVASLGAQPARADHAVRVERALDEIADALDRCLNIRMLMAIADLRLPVIDR
jgi:adenosylcobyric acid synthase